MSLWYENARKQLQCVVKCKTITSADWFLLSRALSRSRSRPASFACFFARLRLLDHFHSHSRVNVPFVSFRPLFRVRSRLRGYTLDPRRIRFIDALPAGVYERLGRLQAYTSVSGLCKKKNAIRCSLSRSMWTAPNGPVVVVARRMATLTMKHAQRSSRSA